MASLFKGNARSGAKNLDKVRLDLPGLMLLTPRVHADERGQFSETFNAARFKEVTGLDIDFVQDNESVSVRTNTIRGLHAQLPPFAQSKLVRVITGRIVDVVVDIRKGSPTYLSSFTIELRDDDPTQLFVPRGFLHGFRTLTPSARIAYKVDNFYNAEADRSVAYDDPDLDCDWALRGSDRAYLSPKDKKAMAFRDLEKAFIYDELMGDSA